MLGRIRGAGYLLIAVLTIAGAAPALAQDRPQGRTAEGAASAAPAIPAGLERFEHFVFIMQENRSFDSYFGTYPGVNGIPPGVCLQGPAGTPCVAPYHDTNDVNRGGPHGWDNASADIDGGLMDGFVVQSYTGQGNHCTPPSPTCTPGRDPRDVMGWHDWREIPNYWIYAQLFVLQEAMFESVASYSLPAHLYMLAAQSGGYVGSAGQTEPSTYNFPEITELLGGDRITWKYYVTSGSEPDTEDGHVVGTPEQQQQDPHKYTLWNPLPAFPAVANNPAQNSRLQDTAQFYADAAAGKLPQVSWVIPSGAVSEHPPSSVSTGMAYVTGLVNAVMMGPQWATTAIFISWDDWGGFYDHVPPPKIDYYGFGLRVPGLVVSPYSRWGYVDPRTYSFESWLRIVEERFGVVPMTERDSTASDMLDAFDFTQAPRSPVLLAPTLQGSHYPDESFRVQRHLARLGPAPIVGPLHTAGTEIRDGQDRTVTFHGVNSSGLEWGAGQPGAGGSCGSRLGCWALPAEREYPRLQTWGFNVVRVPVSWSNLEPAAPVGDVHAYNAAYLAALDSVIAELGNRHIPVILDMHQWSWSPAFVAPRRSDGKIVRGCGMPAWLYPSATGKWSGGPEAARVQAQVDFFTDKDDVQDGFIAAWRMLAARYAENPNVIGADMFNEPGIYPTDSVKQVVLDEFYARVATAIRTVNPTLLLIFESGPHTPVAQPPPFDNVVYSFHAYPSAWTQDAQDALDEQWQKAQGWNVPVWLGEFSYAGPKGEPEGDDGWRIQTLAMLQFLKYRGIGWTYWAYQRSPRPIDDPQVNSDLVQALQAGF